MIGEVLVGRYRIEKELGRGGFGETFLARDLQMPKEPLCVVKHLKPFTDNPQLIEIATRLFKKEAEILAELGEHPQIPRLYAYFTQGEDFYLVQEFIEGKDLTHEMQKRWNRHTVCKLIIEVMEILEFVHGKGVIHRDIKPQNIIRRATDNKLVLIDFGAVKEISQTAMQNTGIMSASVVVGSIGYMAPEQGQGKPRFASDIYSVGMMAIQALTGKQPRELQEDPKTGEVAWRHLVDFDNKLLDVIERMVKYDYRERYGSAREVLAVLENSGAETKVSADSFSEPMVVTPTQTVSPSKTAEEFFNDGLKKQESGDNQGAIADYSQAVRLNPNLALAYNNRGLVKYDLGDKEGAIADFNQAIRLNPDFAGAYLNRGNVKSALGDKQGAIADFNQAIRLQPDYAEAYNNRGVVKYELGDKQGAIADYSQAIRLQPDYAEAYSNRGNAKFALGDKQGALADVNQAIRLQPDYANAYFGRGVVKYELGNKQGAIADLQEAARLSQRQGNIEMYNKTQELLKLIIRQL